MGKFEITENEVNAARSFLERRNLSQVISPEYFAVIAKYRERKFKHVFEELGRACKEFAAND